MTDNFIQNIHLKNLHVTIHSQTSLLCKEDIVAKMRVSYNFDSSKKLIIYRITVGKDEEDVLFVLKCEYEFICLKEIETQDLVELMVKKLQPNIEELMSFMTLESGYVQLN